MLTVALEGGTLFVIDGLERIELFPESATRFFELVEEHDLEFVKGPDGAVSHLLLDGQQKVPRIGGAPGTSRTARRASDPRARPTCWRPGSASRTDPRIG